MSRTLAGNPNSETRSHLVLLETRAITFYELQHPTARRTEEPIACSLRGLTCCLRHKRGSSGNRAAVWILQSLMIHASRARWPAFSDPPIDCFRYYSIWKFAGTTLS